MISVLSYQGSKEIYNELQKDKKLSKGNAEATPYDKGYTKPLVKGAFNEIIFAMFLESNDKFYDDEGGNWKQSWGALEDKGGQQIEVGGQIGPFKTRADGQELSYMVLETRSGSAPFNSEYFWNCRTAPKAQKFTYCPNK